MTSNTSTRDDDQGKLPYLAVVGPQRAATFSGQHLETMANMRFKSFSVEAATRDSLIQKAEIQFPKMLANWAIQAYENYERSQDMDDIQMAVELARGSTQLGLGDDSSCLYNLGTMLLTQYTRIGNMADLKEAIRTIKQAVELIPDNNHPDQATYLNTLANALQSSYAQTGNIVDLEEALNVQKQAVKLTPDESISRETHLNTLGIILDCWYNRTGNTSYLEEAIGVVKQAVELAPDNHSHRATALDNLGIMFRNLYDRTSNITDLEKAISVSKQAVELTPNNDPHRASKLNNLGNKFRSLYDRTRNIADLENAISIAKQAVELTPDDHPKRASRLNNLGLLIESWYYRTNNMADLEKAYDVIQQAIELTPDNHPDRVSWLNNLGALLYTRYWSVGNMADLEKAIDVAKQAVELTPDNHPDRGGRLNTLGVMLENRYQRTGDTTDLEDASSRLCDAWDCQNAIPFTRIKAAARLLPLLAIQSKVAAGIKIGKAVIDLLPAVNTKLLNRGDQQFVISTFAGVAADVCALFLEFHQPIDALEHLEKGRAVIIGQLVDDRHGVIPLGDTHPDLAHRYKDIQSEVNTQIDELGQGIGQAQIADRRRQALAKLDECIQEIRGVAGYERFLLGQAAAEMQQCAVGGVIVVVNMTKFRSDAILISPTAIKTLSLPMLLASDANAWLDEKWRGPEVRRSEKPKKNKKYLEYLTWLWDVCVKIILDEVCITSSAADDMPRIWWVGTGLASSMPFHAAGVHTSGSTKNAFSRVISSYTPSIKALGYAQYRARIMEGARGSLLIVTMPTTPKEASQPYSYTDLPGVVEEREKISNLAAGRIPLEFLDLPSVDQVVDKLPGCSMAHFACHGSTDHKDPSNSRLILQKRGEGQEEAQDFLTVQRVSELSLAHAQIAYLSACSTAENKAARLSDEAIHVVSGFQVAGFPHVVGSLWTSNDRVCVEVASGFYRSLFQQKSTGWSGREVAWAVHEAVMAARKVDMEMPLEWAQFVHFGA
ncbi:CHAT domain-containing protein [Xylaria scruposa]|nr:CHAT domain-containing protein [Xylaria scruposa]